MAAIMALVFVPTLGVTLLMLGMLRGDLTFATAAMATTFVALATGVLAGLFKLVGTWEDDTLEGR
jgi:hypothetical protein